MNTLELAACVAAMTMLGLVLWCLDLRDEAAAAARSRHPATQALPSAVAIFCGSCGRPVRYQVHPNGRRDAVVLHRAYECEASSLIRRKADT